jgi:glycine/D-amino acid oxidase-like deaminating enzyme
MQNLPGLSFWEQSTFFDGVDFAIIGSGIVGLNAALDAREKFPDLKIVIFERGPFPVGASTRNAGFACFGSLTELLDDLENMSEVEMMDLVRMRWQGLQKLRGRVGDATMDFNGSGNFEIFRKEEKETFENCADRIAHFNQLMEETIGKKETYSVVPKAEFPFAGIDYVIKNQWEGQINTGKMMEALLNKAYQAGIKIFNGIAISGLEGRENGVVLKNENNWPLFAKKVLVATNGFANQLIENLALEPARNQVLITEPIPGLKVKGCFHYDKGYIYFRNVGNRILLGGARNLFKKEEATTEFGQTAGIQNALENILKEVILPGQDYKIAQWWSGIMGVGPVKAPIIQMHSPKVGIAVRMGGMGVAMGSLIGEKAIEMLYP